MAHPASAPIQPRWIPRRGKESPLTVTAICTAGPLSSRTGSDVRPRDTVASTPWSGSASRTRLTLSPLLLRALLFLHLPSHLAVVHQRGERAGQADDQDRLEDGVVEDNLVCICSKAW